MSKHYDNTILYKGESRQIHIQCLSEEFPITYAVWLRQDEKKESFDNTYVLFCKKITGNMQLSDSTEWHSVFYSRNSIEKNLEFEKAVWNVIDAIEDL